MSHEEYLKSIDTIARNHITLVTIQIWDFQYIYNRDRGEEVNTPKPFGTGILVAYMGRKFIFTAQHVTEERSDQPLYIRTGPEEFSTITGDVRMIRSNDAQGIDLAFIELDGETISNIERIQNHGFLEPENIGFGGSLLENEPVVAMGFPELKTKVDRYDLSITSIGSIWLLKGAPGKMYNYYKKDKTIVYGLNYHGVQTGILSDQKSKKIDPEGISGGGVWKVWVQPFMGEELVRYHLIGILTDYKKSKYHVLWANQIELLMDFINRTYGLPLNLEPTS